ncbi:hypothetical protein SteCoe_11013 [Stentor coeruleus]|uniref:Uncharacterized protein n=1 Tax=Stentor coeruleus TaxID=5963 RepID=A0A1R2CED7_9CILI|nr:hypothetical protein SteCoe_11013 [Stentor coeruleus]
MDDDIYSYIGIKAPNHVKKSSTGRCDGLTDRVTGKSGKLNSMKIKQKANDLKEMRSIPKINQNSRKIAEGLKRERMDIVAKYEERFEVKAPESMPEPVKISVNILKYLDKIDESTPVQPDLKSMSVHERTKYWKEQKDKKLEEQRKAKKDQELNGCTFKPKKSESQDFENPNRPLTVPKAQEKNTVKSKPQVEKTNSLKTVTSLGKFEPQRNENESLAMMLKGQDFASPTPNAKVMKNPKYSANFQVRNDETRALSASRSVKLKQGFLSELAKPKGKKVE